MDFNWGRFRPGGIAGRAALPLGFGSEHALEGY